MLPMRMGCQVLSSLPFLALATLLHKLYRHLSRYAFSRRQGCHMVTSRAPVRDPFLGFDFLYGSIFAKSEDKYLEASRKAFQTLGRTYTVKRWSWEVMYTCDIHNIKHLLAGGFHDFALPRLRVSVVSTLLGQGIFTLNGSSWAHSRSVLKPMFAGLDKEAITGAMERHFQAMLRLIPDDSSLLIDLQSLYFRLTMDFAGDFLMGNSASMLDPSALGRGKAERFVRDYGICSREVVKRLRLGPLQHLRFSLKAFCARRRVFRYIDDFIDESLQRASRQVKPGQGRILSELAAMTKDRKALRNQVLHVLIASRDTTASVLGNLFFVLPRNPSIYKRLREEVQSVAGLDAPTAAHLTRMDYLKWCVNESLRLHPVIPTNAREATRDTTIPRGGGTDGNSPLFVPKGVVVMYNVYTMHRDERVFGSDPEAFRPDRWRNLRPGWGYLPFNGGPRICMGREQLSVGPDVGETMLTPFLHLEQVALTEVQYVVARMAQTFEAIVGHGEGEWAELDALTTTYRDGVRVSLTRAHEGDLRTGPSRLGMAS